MSSSFGTLFRVTTFGESHCKGVGAIVDGVPPRLEISQEAIQKQLDRRRPGQSDLSTPREEKDTVTILSGTENGITLGTPIAFLVENENQRPSDYSEMSAIPRPSHADYTYLKKYGVKASSGGGRSSARETIGRVAAGALAELFLTKAYGIEIVAYVSSVGTVKMSDIDITTVSRDDVDQNAVRCPDLAAAEKMQALILEAKNNADSIGGVVSCVIRNVPAGWGEPVFDKFEARLAQAMLSIPATKGFEIGSGFEGSTMFGSQHNDRFVVRNGKIGTATNFSGGIQGGITNGEAIYFKVAFKPPATIGKAQQTIDFDGNEITLEAKGRHDPCVVPRAVPVVEAMAALVLADMALIQSSREHI